jgi:hypothetical protein
LVAACRSNRSRGTIVRAGCGYSIIGPVFLLARDVWLVGSSIEEAIQNLTEGRRPRPRRERRVVISLSG